MGSRAAAADRRKPAKGHVAHTHHSLPEPLHLEKLNLKITSYTSLGRWLALSNVRSRSSLSGIYDYEVPRIGADRW